MHHWLTLTRRLQREVPLKSQWTHLRQITKHKNKNNNKTSVSSCWERERKSARKHRCSPAAFSICAAVAAADKKQIHFYCSHVVVVLKKSKSIACLLLLLLLLLVIVCNLAEDPNQSGNQLSSALPSLSSSTSAHAAEREGVCAAAVAAVQAHSVLSLPCCSAFGHSLALPLSLASICCSILGLFSFAAFIYLPFVPLFIIPLCRAASFEVQATFTLFL